MSLAMIVRADMGGLASQTHELWKRLRPERTIVVRIANPRGWDRVGMYDAPWTSTIEVMHARLSPVTLAGLAARHDHLVSAETFYADTDLVKAKRILIANPELYAGEECDTMILPSVWVRDRWPEAKVIPQPTPDPPAEFVRTRTEAKVFLHTGAPAMRDRNGTEVFLKACSMMQERAVAIVRGRTVPKRMGRVEIVCNTESYDDWWDAYTPEADALVIPRRYGGQCLPAQEGAVCGLPLVMPRLSPQNTWPGPRFGAALGPQVAMKGGPFVVHRPVPRDLARVMDRMVRGEIDVEHESEASLAWAEETSWANIEPLWREILT